MYVEPIETAVDLACRVRSEFLEMPGMRLSVDQAVRLWALDRPTCQAVLERLTTNGFLQRDDRGLYKKADAGY